MSLDADSVPLRSVPRLIGGDEIHIYRANLDGAETEQTLSLDERTRAARFHFVRDRRRFVVGRTFVRFVLARYLDINPAEVRFGYTEFGKPFLSDNTALPMLSFNVAHSDNVAMMAVARGREIGIDIERHRSGFASDNLAEQFFSPEEVRAIRCLRPEEQERAFFDCWTRKEAYIKARGQGLSIPLNGFIVSTARQQISALLATPHDPYAVTQWRVRDIEAPAGFSAALAYELGIGVPKLVVAD